MAEKLASVVELADVPEEIARDWCCSPECGPLTCGCGAPTNAALQLIELREEQTAEECCGPECGPACA